MSSSLCPYLNFPGTAREAMAFYQEVFGGELTASTFAEFGGPDVPFADQIMHSQLEAPGLMLMGADFPSEMGELKAGNNMTVALFGDDAETMHGWWEQLCAGGTVTSALQNQVWGDEFGMCSDKFGTPWMVNISAPRG